MNTQLLEGQMAWLTDIEMRAESPPLPQVEIIPLICIWHAVQTVHNTRRISAKDFMEDTLAIEEITNTLGSRLLHGLNSGWKSELGRVIPLNRWDGVSGLLIYEAVAIRDGRHYSDRVTPKESVLAGLIGHATYNSTSGGQMIGINPLGPHPKNPLLWQTLGFEQSNDFARRLYS